MDERELEQLFEKLRGGVDLTDDEMRKLGRNTGSVSKAFEFVGKQSLDLASKLNKGAQGASVYNDTIISSADALGDLTKKLGPLGKALGLTVKGLGEYAAQVNLLSDRLFKNYQNLSKVGVSAADGMIGLGEAAQRLGLGIDEAGLENFGRLMKGAAVDLALLSGSAVQGREDFVQFAEILVRGPVGRELQNLGYSVEELNEGLADYIGLQARVGLAQNKTQAELRAGAAAYLKEMDGLTKLTGIQRAEMEEGINKARAVEAFRAKVEDLRAQDRHKEADNMELYYSILLKQAPTLAQGYAEAASNLIVSPAGRQFFQAIQAGTGVIEGLSTGTMTLEQALGATYKQAKLSEEQFRGLAMAMAAGDVVGSYVELADIAKRSGINQEETARIIKETQEAQAKGPGGVAAQTDLRRTQMETRDSLQSLVKLGIAPVTGAMRALAGVTNSIVSALGGTPGGGYAREGVMGGGVSGGPAAGAAGGAAASPKVFPGGILGGVEDFITGGRGFGSYTAPTPSQLNIDDLFSFTGGTGSRENFDRLDPDFRNRLIRMAADYHALHQKPITFSSGARTQDENIQVGGAPSSRHMSGLAADLSSADVAALKAAGLLDRYGFKQNPNSAWHISDTGYAMGGIASGPRSGYAATLHGTEAVVPLPDGKTIPVQMPELASNMSQQLSMMGSQLVALQNIAAAMRDQNSISTKILQAANN